MKTLTTILAASLLLGGCATSLKAPPTLTDPAADFSGRPADCNIEDQVPESAMNCARAMQSAYQGAANALAREDKHAGLALVTLGVGAAGTAVFSGDGGATKGIGILAALISGQNAYLNPKKISQIYAQAARRMACVVSRAGASQSTNRSHVSSMIEMKKALEMSKSASLQVQALATRAYELCEYSDAGLRVGGDLAYDPTKTEQALESSVMFHEIMDVVSKIDGNTMTSVSSGLGALEDPRKGASDILNQYFKQQEQQQSMTEVANEAEQMGEAAADTDPVAPAPVAGAAEKTPAQLEAEAEQSKIAAVELAKVAKSAAESAKQADQAAAELAACADAQ